MPQMTTLTPQIHHLTFFTLLSPFRLSPNKRGSSSWRGIISHLAFFFSACCQAWDSDLVADQGLNPTPAIETMISQLLAYQGSPSLLAFYPVPISFHNPAHHPFNSFSKYLLKCSSSFCTTLCPPFLRKFHCLLWENSSAFTPTR